jgi:hypothetical protein
MDIKLGFNKLAEERDLGGILGIWRAARSLGVQGWPVLTVLYHHPSPS